MIERTIAASTHGRYLVEPARGADRAPMLVGFHGYAEPAETELERLRAIPGSERWLLVSIQGLHRFYRGQSRVVVASWMTRQDREAAIADNTAYVTTIIDEAGREWGAAPTIVFAGFSQGVAMAWRAACSSPRRVASLIVLGGDIPPELDRGALAAVNAVLIGRGQRDELYSADLNANDEKRLREAGVDVHSVAIEAGHEWTADFSAAAGRFLDRQTR